MISILGRTAVLVGLATACTGSVSGIVSGLRRSEQGLRLTRRLAWAFALAMIAAAALMEYALLTHDFSVSYVAHVGSRSAPLYITIVSLWSALDGSILFWGLVLGLYTAGFAWASRRSHVVHTSYALGALLAVGVFFGFLVAGVANPFAPVSPVPPDGPGPNPLLQNHVLMIAHPPALYLGYVGMSVPFAMGVAALLAGRLDAAWLRDIRRWTLLAWAFLSLGILLGGWWSYEVLGWGGYWAWDPVENASFLPWLTATAFLHSAIASDNRGRLRGWTVTLLLGSFVLTLLGTFMTRSGVFNSVHSFTQSAIGPVFLAFIAIVLLVSVVLLSARLQLLAGRPAAAGSPASREGGFLVNNLLLVAITFTVLLGTVFPLLVEALRDQRISVGQPYFDRMTGPLFVALIYLMGIGPSLPWGRADLGRLRARLLLPGIAAIALPAVAFAFGARSVWMLLTWSAAAFAGVVSARELLGPAMARARARGQPFLRALPASLRRARRRTAAHAVHVGVLLVAVAATASSAGRQEILLNLSKGESAQAAGYTLTYLGHHTVRQPNRSSERALFSVSRGGAELGELSPAMNHYPTMREPIASPAVLSRPSGDLYLSLVRVDPDSGSVALRVFIEPMVAWLWLGGLVVFGGGLLGAWPERRRTGRAGAEAAS